LTYFSVDRNNAVYTCIVDGSSVQTTAERQQQTGGKWPSHTSRYLPVHTTYSSLYWQTDRQTALRHARSPSRP